MSRRGWRTVFDRHLVDGLTVDERIAALEGKHARAVTAIDRAIDERRREARWENDMLEAWIRRFESMNFVQRLRWLATGVLTWTPPRRSEGSR